MAIVNVPDRRKDYAWFGPPPSGTEWTAWRCWRCDRLWEVDAPAYESAVRDWKCLCVVDGQMPYGESGASLIPSHDAPGPVYFQPDLFSGSGNDG